MRAEVVYVRVIHAKLVSLGVMYAQVVDLDVRSRKLFDVYVICAYLRSAEQRNGDLLEVVMTEEVVVPSDRMVRVAERPCRVLRIAA